ncbi:hypothetical protein HK405_013697, partial [Cladochytrium tenue]
HQQQQQSSTSSYSAPATALSPQLSTSRRSRTSGATSSAEPITLRWHELLTHFRNVQLRHERSRRPGYRSSTHPGDRSTSQRRRAGRADADASGGADGLQRVGTPVAGSSPAPMSRSPLPAPHQSLHSTLAAAAGSAARTPSPLLPTDAAPLAPYVMPAATVAAGGSRSTARRRQESTGAAGGTPAAAASTLGPPAPRAAVTGGVEMGESLSASSVSSLDNLDRLVFSGGGAAGAATASSSSGPARHTPTPPPPAGPASAAAAAQTPGGKAPSKGMGIRKVVGFGSSKQR